MLTFVLLAALLGYLLGSIPSALWLAKARGIDIFSLGSSNMGAMNVARNMGWGWGVLVLVADVAKAALAMYLGKLLLLATPYSMDSIGIIIPLTAGLFAIVGHLFSFLAGFRGGKALASSFGLYLMLLPWAALTALLGLVALIALTRRQIRGILLMALCYPFVIAFFAYRAGWHWWLCALQAALIAALVARKHWSERHPDPPLF